MLRNLSTTNTNGSGILGTPLVGVLASELPTGFPLPGLLNNDVAQGDPAGCLYRVEITSQPSAGVLAVDEFGAFSFTDAPDGTYTGTEKVYKNGVPTDGTYSLTIGGSGGTGLPTVTGVVITPNGASLAGLATQQFAATVSGTNAPSQAVTWSMTGAGSLSAGGLYTAPAATSASQTATITATSVADGTKSSSVTVTVAAQQQGTPTVTSVTVSPSGATVDTTRQYSAVVAGTNSPAQTVTWSTTLGNIDANGLLTVPAKTSSVQTGTVTATSTVDGTKKGTASFSVPAAVVVPVVTGVVVSPASKQMLGGTHHSFSAVVNGTGSPSQAVTWSATHGTLEVTGAFSVNYKAPDANGSVQTDTLVATSVANGAFAGQASITILADAAQITKTVVVTILASDQQGNPMAGALITATLDRVDIDPLTGFVAPEEISVTADATGTAILNLWPNALGTLGSQYVVVIENPDTGSQMAVQATVPDDDCYLHDIAVLMTGS